MRVSAVIGVAFCLIFAGCSRDKSSSSSSSSPSSPASNAFSNYTAPRQSGGSGSADVTYKPGVQVVEQKAGTDALISVSTDGSTLVFDRSRGGFPELKDGDVFVIKGLLARKVIASESNGNELAVLTIPAGLIDIITDGKIRLQAPIHFGRGQAFAMASPPENPNRVADLFVPQLFAQGPTETRRQEAEAAGVRDAYGNMAAAPFKAVLSGWETKFSTDPEPGKLNIHLQLKKSLAGVAAVITGEGYLADFEFGSDIDVERSTVENLKLEYKKLNGLMNFTWEIQTTEKGSLVGNAKMKLPAAIEIPLYEYLGGLPLFLEISSAVIIKPALNGAYEFSRGGFRITWDGYQKFGAKDGTVDADGQLTGGLQLGESESGSGAPLGLVVALAMPRIELSIGVSKILKFDGMADAAKKADGYFDKLVTKTFGAEALAKIKASPMSQVTAKNIVDAAMGSNAAAYIELTTSVGTSHSGSAAMVPCTRTDLHLAANVGVSAKAFGQSVGDADKELFKLDTTRVKPDQDMLCKF
jgi:hypothetical protein